MTYFIYNALPCLHSVRCPCSLTFPVAAMLQSLQMVSR